MSKMLRLTDIKHEEAFDVAAELMDPIFTIMSDESMNGVFKGEKQVKKNKKGEVVGEESNREYTLRSLKSKVPYLIKEHKPSLIKIFATLKRESEEAYLESLTFASLMLDCLSALNDPALTALFTSAASTGDQTPPTAI